MYNYQTVLDLSYEATNLRKKLGLDESNPIDIFAVANNIKDLTLVFYDLGNNLSGLCYKDIDMIVINSNHSYGRCRFTLAHEFYHYFIENSKDKMICSKSLSNNPSKEEKRADMFASLFLAPYNAFKDKIKDLTKETISVEDIIKLEQYYGLSRLAILYRLKMEGLIDGDWDKYSKNVILQAVNLGYDDKLYQKINFHNKTYGKYISLVHELMDKNIISKGKQTELLLTAFRSDLLEGDLYSDTNSID